MKFYSLILAILGVWRLTHLLTKEDGPWGVCARLRTAVDGQLGRELLGCFYCSSLWIAAPFAVLLGESWGEQLLLELALSSGAILAERVTARNELLDQTMAWEEPEVDHGMLRKEHTPKQNAGEDGIS